ncbi:hypothetical protein KAT92_00940 [Candidatus Babeliales bacterium]|nr:hypothetical protein [Candidatus Babeliales bacterium]
MKRFFLCLAICSLFATNSNATKLFQANTDNPQILCALETLSHEESKDFFGLSHIPEQINLGSVQNGNTVTTYYQDHPLRTLPKNYMPVKVEIVNNTESPIYLERDKYLQGIENSFIPRKAVLNLYPSIKHPDNTKKIALSLLGSAALATLGIYEGILMPWWKKNIAEKAEQDEEYTIGGNYNVGYSWLPKNTWVRSEHQSETTTRQIVRICGDLTILGVAATSFILLYLEQAADKKNLVTNKKARKELMKKPFITKDVEKKFPKTCPEESDFLKISPGESLQDQFLIDLRKSSRETFSNHAPQLIYSGEA